MTTFRFRQFELECSIKCQDLNINDFRVWLNEKDYPTNVLMSYAFKKFNFVSLSNITNELIDEISNYIYQKYRYGYSSTIPDSSELFNFLEVDDLPELDDLPEVDDLSELVDIEDNMEDELLSLMTNLRNTEPREDLMTSDNMTAALMNDYISANLFYDMMNRIKEERLLNRKFKIESIVEAVDINYTEVIECSICFESYKSKDFVSLNCKHEFCKTCLKNSIKSDKREHPCCAYCRGDIIKMTSRTIEVHSELSELIL